MLSSIQLFCFVSISLVVLALHMTNGAPVDSDVLDELSLPIDEQNTRESRSLKRKLPLEGILIGRRSFPHEGILIGRRSFPNQGMLIGRRTTPDDDIILGKYDYPTEGILIGRRSRPTEGIMFRK